VGYSAAFGRWSTAATLLAFDRRAFDVDIDDDVDLIDFAAFASCVNGPAGQYQPDCDVFDSDADGDVDLLDFSGLQRAFNRP
jgi:hypothetical protein